MIRPAPADAGGAAFEAVRADRLRRWSLALLISTLFTLVTACAGPPRPDASLANIDSHGAAEPARTC